MCFSPCGAQCREGFPDLAGPTGEVERCREEAPRVWRVGVQNKKKPYKLAREIQTKFHPKEKKREGVVFVAGPSPATRSDTRCSVLRRSLMACTGTRRDLSRWNRSGTEEGRPSWGSWCQRPQV